MEIREVRLDEVPAAWELGRLAFGSGPRPTTPRTPEPSPGAVRYGAFDADGRLLGGAIDLDHEQWWAGRRVASADVAGVAVLPEARGRGVARSLLVELLRGARERGAAISALFPTVAAPYRSCGWESAGVLRTVDLATAALPRHRPSAELSVRPGDATDLPAVQELYQQVARYRCGMLTREGVLFARADDELPEWIDGLTLVEDGGRLVGYAAWQRGAGYDATGVLTVHDLLATTGAAARELVGVLASWQSVAPTVRLRLLDHDAVAAQLPLERSREYRQQVWMHRPVDVVRAVADRGWPPYARGTVDFAVDDPQAPWNTGSWRLEVADGEAELRHIAEEPAVRLSVRGFALLYTGSAPARAVAEAGLLRCAAGHDPAALDLLGAGPAAQLLNYF